MKTKKHKKLSETEKKIEQAFNRIRKLEKRFEQDILKSACNKYAVLVREKNSALARKKVLENELASLKDKI
jgi:hypothetical protein